MPMPHRWKQSGRGNWPPEGGKYFGFLCPPSSLFYIHLSRPRQPFWGPLPAILQAVRRCRQWARAPVAARLVFSIIIFLTFPLRGIFFFLPKKFLSRSAFFLLKKLFISVIIICHLFGLNIWLCLLCYITHVCYVCPKKIHATSKAR